MCNRTDKTLHNWWRIQPVGSVHRNQDREEAKLIGPGKETRQGLVQTIVKVKYLVRE